MKRGPSPSRRHLAVWFPFLPTERMERVRATEGPPDAPLVLIDKVGGALRLAAVDPNALAQGLSPGMTLADARARLPELSAEAYEPDADAGLLARLLEDFGRFTPMAALDAPHGLILDVTGCGHLFGGELDLGRAVRARTTRLGLTARMAMAGTPQSARALCRFGSGGMFTSDRARRAIRALPVAALEIPDRDTQALRRAGLKTIGEVDDRPRASLAARFGAVLPTRLDRLLELEDTRITPHRPAASITSDRVLLEPITEDSHVETVLRDLLADVCALLERSGLGARVLGLRLFRVDAGVRWLEARSARATRDPLMIARLFKERMAAAGDPLDPGFGFDHLRLEVVRSEPLATEQTAFDQQPSRSKALGDLTDRLAARLGEGCVLRIEALNSHLPERATRWRPTSQASISKPEKVCNVAEPTPVRPLRIFDPPQPIEAIALAPDSPPARFRWRRVDHRVVSSEGPERIEGEWWRRRERVRDYYRVEDAEGRRFWVFRAGRFGEEPPPRWYLHGLFP
ncbi:DNA polymerase Y family protein [Brevundimonas sp.]|uniref:Y-family DNA polymerase n=1 Tax=Brevundimonas sp. TaxID=1871086 RepID=UPI002ABBF2D7|nr:DNA polymerase Y family protein [Brevundimonas sp.]MDZ4363725.1 DNA polymerase Y family protein [Brevundimonas sp.]